MKDWMNDWMNADLVRDDGRRVRLEPVDPVVPHPVGELLLLPEEHLLREVLLLRAVTRPLSTRGGTRCVHLVRNEGRDVSN